MHVYTMTEAAGGHANEDAIACCVHPHHPDALLCALADGQGGQAGGKIAAQTAVAAAIDAASCLSLEELLDPDSWTAIGEQVDIQIAGKSGAGFNTLVTLVITSEWVMGASVGDSMALLLLDDLESVLTDAQSKHPPVGSGEACFMPFSAMLAGNWRLLIMTDGVWKGISWNSLIATARNTPGSNISAILRKIVIGTSTLGLPDDFSIIFIEP